MMVLTTRFLYEAGHLSDAFQMQLTSVSLQNLATSFLAVSMSALL